MRFAALNVSEWQGASAPNSSSPAPNVGAAVAALHEAAWSKIGKASGVPYHKRVGKDAILASHVAGLVLGKEQLPDTAVIMSAEQGHLTTAWRFATRALDQGVGLVDPLQFPATLPSYAPTVVAAVHGCHGPALSAGCGDRGLDSAVSLGLELLHAKIVSHAVVITARGEWIACGEPWVYAAAALFLAADIEAGADAQVAKFQSLVSTLRAGRLGDPETPLAYSL